MRKDNSSRAGAAPFDAQHTAPAALQAQLRKARRNNPGAFICQANRVVTNPRCCEHCGQTSSGVCGELPIVLERITPAASAMLAALKGLISTMEHCSVSAGVCMCGDDMASHPDPMSCGHSPVDMGQYHADAAYKTAHEAIRAAESAGIK